MRTFPAALPSPDEPHAATEAAPGLADLTMPRTPMHGSHGRISQRLGHFLAQRMAEKKEALARPAS